MIKLERITVIIVVFFSLFACNEAEIPVEANEAQQESTENLRYTDILDEQFNELSEEDFAYMYALPEYDPKELALALEKESQKNVQNRCSEQVWGIGAGRTVWKWNGASWGQPNSAARLDIVEVSKNCDGSVWGIGKGATVWKWNGASWGQPNPAARLIRISVHSSNIAFGVAKNKTLFVTTNGGQNWAPFTNFQNAYWISSGDYFNLLTASNSSGELFKYDLFSYQMEPIMKPANTSIGSHTTMFGGGVWVVEGNYGNVYTSVDYINYILPNSNNPNFNCISTNDSQKAWATSHLSRRVWKTTNSGVTWYQPNDAARLDYISAAF